ncbi:putative signal peptide protein [Puccinia sorghi]|uniref:Putative signal peptide protein n=1 Tax=Puccinia sorghi TaxID=27349 RepID=A0A0L6VBF5_9BASI|nr:putative signal peptide protein [Puccinia sorghi]
MQTCGVWMAAWLEHAACQLQTVEQVFFSVLNLVWLVDWAIRIGRFLLVGGLDLSPTLLGMVCVNEFPLERQIKQPKIKRKRTTCVGDPMRYSRVSRILQNSLLGSPTGPIIKFLLVLVLLQFSKYHNKNNICRYLQEGFPQFEKCMVSHPNSFCLKNKYTFCIHQMNYYGSKRHHFGIISCKNVSEYYLVAQECRINPFYWFFIHKRSLAEGDLPLRFLQNSDNPRINSLNFWIVALELWLRIIGSIDSLTRSAIYFEQALPNFSCVFLSFFILSYSFLSHFHQSHHFTHSFTCSPFKFYNFRTKKINSSKKKKNPLLKIYILQISRLTPSAAKYEMFVFLVLCSYYSTIGLIYMWLHVSAGLEVSTYFF